jgi:hypothetical protein
MANQELALSGGFAVLLAAVLSLGSGAVATLSVGFPPTKGSKQYLMLETFDVATDIIAVWFTSDAGDLEFANDPLGLVKIFLVISVVISCVSYVVEMFLRCSNTMDASRASLRVDAGLRAFHCIYDEG